MRTHRTVRGQSIAEYVVLFAIVIGAAIAMQQFIKGQLQGGVKTHGDSYLAAVTEGSGAAYEPDRTTTSNSNNTATESMTTATQGSRSLTSTGTSTSAQTK